MNQTSTERHVKIVCTLGPASNSTRVIDGLIRGGMNVALSVENLDTLIAQHGKDYTYITYPNADHNMRDTDTEQFYPIMIDALNWMIERFGD